ncbi:MAG: hypothetical protein AAB537_01600 [Patescibacteria group bacterium]
MKKDKRKKKELFTNTDMKRYIGALSENFTKQVGGVAEQWLGVKKDTGEIKEILNTHTEILQRHGLILNHHTEILESHDKTLNSHTEMIGKVMLDMTILKEDMEFLKGGIKRKVDYDEFLALERRTAILETKARVA